MDYSSVANGLVINLTIPTVNDGQGGTDTLSQIENVRGSNTGGDLLTGDGLANIFYGNGGADTLTGGGLNDLLYLGTDLVTDTVNYTSGDGSDTVHNFVRGVGGDILNFSGIASIDIKVSGTSTQFRVGDGIAANTGFGAGLLLLTTSATSGFTTTDLGVNLIGSGFLFS